MQHRVNQTIAMLATIFHNHWIGRNFIIFSVVIAIVDVVRDTKKSLQLLFTLPYHPTISSLRPNTVTIAHLLFTFFYLVLLLLHLLSQILMMHYRCHMEDLVRSLARSVSLKHSGNIAITSMTGKWRQERYTPFPIWKIVRLPLELSVHSRDSLHIPAASNKH